MAENTEQTTTVATTTTTATPPSAPVTETEQSSGSGSKILGGILGGAGALYGADHYAKRRVIDKVTGLDYAKLRADTWAASQDPEVIKAFEAKKASIEAKALKETDPKKAEALRNSIPTHDEFAEQSVLKKMGITPESRSAVEEIEGTEKFKKLKEAQGKSEAAKAVDSRLRALGHLESAGTSFDFSQVVFEADGKGFKAHAHLEPAALERMSKESKDLLGVTEKGTLTFHVETLPPGVTFAEGSKTATATIEHYTTIPGAEKTTVGVTKEWLKAEIKTARGIVEKEGNVLLRKSAGLGFGFKNLTTAGKAGVVAATVAGVGVGSMVLHAIFGGKHTDQVVSQQAEQTPAPEATAAR